MNNPYLEKLNKAISAPDFFRFLEEFNIDEMLDMRDEESFDKAWFNCFNIVESKQSSISENDLILINQLRETAYKSSYIALKHSELSSYLSDDIELIAKSMVLNLTDCWAINYLWNKYLHRESPVPMS